MKQFLHRLLLSAVFFSPGLLQKLQAQAQVNTYTFAQGIGVYTPLSYASSTLLLQGTTSGSLDAQNANVSLPFAFTIGTQNQNSGTTAYVNSNGFFSFGTPSSGTSTPISSTTANAIIAAMGWDMATNTFAMTAAITSGSNTITVSSATTAAVLMEGEPVTGTGIPSNTFITSISGTTVTLSNNATATNASASLTVGASIRSATIGSEFVIQFSNFARYNNYGAIGGLNFQIRLTETSNVIKVVYGPNATTYTGATYPQVGLRGLSNSDYNNRTGPWSATTGGTSNSATVTLNSTTVPPSGLTFTWSPPTCFRPTITAPTNVTATSTTLNWTAPSMAPSNGYEYEVRSSGIPGSGATGLAASGNTAAGVTTANVTGLSPVTTYSVYVRGFCGGTDYSAWTVAYTFTTACAAVSVYPYVQNFGNVMPTCWLASEGSASASQHWQPVSADGSNGASGPQAGTNFMRLNVYNASTSYNPYYLTTEQFALPATAKQLTYYYFLGNSGYKGTTGATGSDPYPLVVQISTNGGTSWADLYSHNNINSTFAADGNVSNWKQNTVNLSAYANQTITIRFKSMSNFGNGRVNQGVDEFVIENIPSCLPPVLTAPASITPTGADLSWTPPATPPSGGYEYEVRSSGVPGSGATGLAASGNTAAGITTANVTGLTANTSYAVYVRSFCGGTDYSAWSAAYAFTTPCDAFNVPYTENFDGITTPAIPSCTVVENVNGDNKTWATSTSAPSSAPNHLAYSYHSSNAANDWWFTPGLNLTSGSTYQITFKYRGSSTSWPEKLEVKVGNAQNAAAMTGAALWSATNISNTTYATATVDYAATATGVHYFGWHAFSDANMNVIYIDDISIIELIPCSGAPAVATASASSGSVCPTASITLNATGLPAAGVTGITYQWQSRPAAGGAFTDITGATAASYTFTGQTVATEYQLLVKCNNAGGSTTPSNPVTVNQNPLAACYCTPAPTSGCGSGDVITNVVLENISNNTGAICAGTFQDYTALSTDLTQGATYTASVTLGVGGSGSATGGVAIWIDFNNNGVFETTERFAATASVTSGNTATVNIPLALAAPLGSHRMRVRMVRSTAGTGMDPCANYSYGETEDYLVNILAAPVCNSMPDAPVASANASAVCTNTPLTLSAIGTPPSNLTGITYQWQSAPAGSGTFTNIAGATTASYVIASQAEATDYQLLVTCDAGGTAISNVVSVGQNSFFVCYCTPVGTNTSYYINNFSTTGGTTDISNLGTGRQTGGYGDFTSQSVSAMQGTSIDFSAQYAGTTFGTKIWVDWNQDGDFTDPGEQVFASSSYSNNQAGTITVPLTALTGNTRMRIGISSTPNTGPSGPCVTTNLSGEFEDYTFTVIAQPACTGTPAPGTVSASPAALCVSGSATLSLADYTTGVAGISIQWEEAADATGPFAPVSAGGTTASYTTGTLTATTYYRAAVTCAHSGETDYSNVVAVTVNNPALTNTTPGSRCGFGSVTLGATPAAGYGVNWYAAATGGTPLATGNTFNTPVIAASTTYYAAAATTPIVLTNLGNNGTPSNTLLSAERGIVVSVSQSGVLNTAQFYAASGNYSGTARLTTATGTTLTSTTVSGTASSAGFQTMTLDWYMEAGQTYRLLFKLSTGSYSNSNSGVNYASPVWNNFGSAGLITSGYDDGNISTSYSNFYNMQYTMACESPRMAVTATVTPAPEITISADATTVCAGASTMLHATSGNPGYTYSWTPGGATGADVSVTPASPATTYTVVAADNSGGAFDGCGGTAQITINTSPLPNVPVATASPTTICAGSSSVLTVPQQVGTLTSTQGGSGLTPYAQLYEGQRTQYLILASELGNAGMSAGNITALAWNVTEANTTKPFLNYTVKMIQTNVSALASDIAGSFTTVYQNASMAPPVAGWNTINFSTPFVWDGTSNIVVSVCFENDLGGALNGYSANSIVSASVTPFNSVRGYYQDNGATCTSGGTLTTSTTRPVFRFTGASGISWSNGATTIGTGSTITVAPVATTSYTPSMTSSFGCVGTGTPVTVTVAPAPAITTQPTGAILCAGAPLILGVAADNATGYQWYRNGVAIPGAATATYAVFSAGAADNGDYYVRVSGNAPCSPVNSNTVTVSVSIPPAITSHPVAQTICNGSSLTLSVAANNAAGYQWYHNGAPVGASSNTYTVSNATAADAGNYYAVVLGANPCSNITSNTVAVTVNDPVTITTQPAGTTLCDGAALSLSVTANNATAYQWYLDGNPISGATSAVYTVTGASAADAGDYYVVVNGNMACGSVNSNTAVVSVTAPGTWTGASNTDWTNASNWCGGVPTPATDVFIPGTAPTQPVIQSAYGGSARNLTIDDGALVTVQGTLNLYGSLYYAGAGSLNATNGTLYLAGAVAQTFPNVPLTLKRLTVTGGSDKTFTGNVTISEALTLTNGKVVMDNAVMTLAAAVGAVSGSSGAYIVTLGANSGLKQSVNQDGALFPVGNSTYNPAHLETTQAGGTDFIVRVMDQVLDGGLTGTPVDDGITYVVNRTWDVRPDGGTAPQTTMRFYWAQGQENSPSFDYDRVYVAHYNGTQWENLSTLPAEEAPPANGPLDGLYYAMQTGVEAFSPFTVGSGAAPFPLPVALTGISARNEGSSNRIEWQSGKEASVSHYEIEKSRDGNSFTYLSKTEAMNQPFGYITYDDAPFEGLTYYRLKMIDKDGSFAYSKVVSAFMKGKHGFAMSAFPNPAATTVRVKVAGGVEGAQLQLTDLSGRVIARQEVVGGEAEFDVRSLASGVYFIKYADGQRTETIKVNKQ